VVINKGIGTFDLIHDAKDCHCPICWKLVKPEKCGFTSCNYRYIGTKIEEDGKAPETVQLDSPI